MAGNEGEGEACGVTESGRSSVARADRSKEKTFHARVSGLWSLPKFATFGIDQGRIAPSSGCRLAGVFYRVLR